MSKNNARNTRKPPVDKRDPQDNGFDCGFTVKEIIGATFRDKTILFLVKWKESSSVEFVPSQIMNIKCPQLVIEFYEKRLTWTS